MSKKIEKIAVLGSYNLAQILSLGYQPYGFGGYFGFEKGEKKLLTSKKLIPF